MLSFADREKARTASLEWRKIREQTVGKGEEFFGNIVHDHQQMYPNAYRHFLLLCP